MNLRKECKKSVVVFVDYLDNSTLQIEQKLIDDAKDLIDHNEWGVGLENLITNIHENRVKLDNTAIDLMIKGINRCQLNQSWIDLSNKILLDFKLSDLINRIKNRIENWYTNNPDLEFENRIPLLKNLTQLEKVESEQERAIAYNGYLRILVERRSIELANHMKELNKELEKLIIIKST